jgi:hypothetical protein
MSEQSLNPIRLFSGYVSQFGNTLDATMTKRTDLSLEEKVACIEALIEILQIHMENPEEAVDYKLIGNVLTEKIFKPLRNKAVPIQNSKLWQYFEPQSMCYLDYLAAETGRRSFTEEDNLTAEQQQNFLNRAFNLLSLAQTHLYLSSSPAGSDDELIGSTEKSGNREFTLRRQVLVMYYLDRAYNVSNGSDRTHYAHLIELLTGKNYKNIYDYVRNPFPDKTGSRIVDDLKYIKEYFVKLKQDQIITLIDKDIQLHK